MNQPDFAQPKTSGLAITSLVFGILALLLCMIGPLFALPAIVCGHIAMSRVNRSGGMLTGKGLAIAGFIMGYVNLGLMLLLLPIAVPNFVRARQTAQKNTCIANLRLIEAAKQQYALEKGSGAASAPTEADLKPYLGREQTMPTCPAYGVYSIGSLTETATCDMPNHVLTP